MMIKASLCPAGMTVINVYTPKNRAPKHIKQKLTEVNEKRNTRQQ